MKMPKPSNNTHQLLAWLSVYVEKYPRVEKLSDRYQVYFGERKSKHFIKQNNGVYTLNKGL